MFFDEDRIRAVREMILADDEKARRAALAKLLPMQRGDFVELFEIMEGLPVTIRLLDPPLHEFLPHGEDEIAEVAAAMGVDPKKLARPRAASCTSSTRCSASAAAASPSPIRRSPRCRRARSSRRRSRPASAPASRWCRRSWCRWSRPRPSSTSSRRASTRWPQAVAKETGAKVDYQVGTMIELPRAALLAGEIAESAEFFSFGTNDLTQTTFGISRDDAGELPRRLHGARHPAGRPVRRRSTARASASWSGSPSSAAARRGTNLKLGICGEHGGDPASVAFCHEVGLDYVSCSPFRVPIARLAAAQAALGKKAASEAYEGASDAYARIRRATAMSAIERHRSKAAGAWRSFCLPSLARDSEDYDAVAEGLAAAGYRVLRPQPRGIGRSTGPMRGHFAARSRARRRRGDQGARRRQAPSIVGHAYGSWVARIDRGRSSARWCAGVVIAAAAAKQYPCRALRPRSMSRVISANARSGAHQGLALCVLSRRGEVDPKAWLDGWHPAVARQPARGSRRGQAIRLVVRLAQCPAAATCRPAKRSVRSRRTSVTK